MLQRYTRHGLFFAAGTLIAALLLESCKSQELEFVQPFNFVIEDLEPPDITLELEAPVIEEPALPSVQTPSETKQQVSQLSAATTPQDVPAAVQNTLNATASVLTDAGVSASQVNSFDAGDFSSISSTPVSSLNSNILAAGAAAAQDPVLTSLFPSISVPSGRVAAGSASGTVIVENGPMIPFEVTGPCADRARDLFETARAALLQLKADKENETEDFYAPLYTQLSTRQTSRNAKAADSLNVRIARLNSLVSDMLTVSDRFANNADQAYKDLSFQIRSLALVYYLYTYSLIRTVYDLTITANEAAKNSEKSDLDAAKQNNLDFILQKFNETQATYEAALAKSLSDCHNQGGGN